MNTRSVLFSLVLALAAATVACGQNGAIHFADELDTITIPGNTVLGGAATYEAVFIPTGPTNHLGFVFNAHQFLHQDKQLRVSSGRVWGFSAGLSTFPELRVTHIFDSHCWHHAAYVYDGSQERIYIDGVLMASRSCSGNIGDCQGGSDPCNEAIGSNFRFDGGGQQVWRPGFIGYLTSVRISSVARYSGSSFCPPRGDLPNEPGTVLLYNFNEGPGATVTDDESASNRDGHLGRPNLTHMPEFVDDPAANGDITCDGQVNTDDLLVLLADWGECCCRADIDGNGTVDVDDMLALISDWS